MQNSLIETRVYITVDIYGLTGINSIVQKGHKKIKTVQWRLLANFKHKSNYPDLHQSQGGMKFATQISLLLNFYLSKKSSPCRIQIKI